MKILMALVFAASLNASDKVFPFDYTQEDFSNGLRLITIPTDYPNVVSLYIVVQAGSRNEVEPGKTGFAHLFEHMMFRGTEKFPPARYEEALKRAGAASNAYTSDDITVYHTTFAKEDVEGLLLMEADRFQNLKYTADAFKTETRAVLGEYNKNSANPILKLLETLHGTAFNKHTYRHITMGFLKDIEDMPNQYDYSLKFFDRYYRPEYTTIVVAGDIQPKTVRALVEKYWGAWKRGEYKAMVPSEPPPDAPRTARVDWPASTLPWIAVAYRAPAYSDATKDTAALDALAYLGFSENSDLYQKLLIQEQKVDALRADNEDHVDPYLFTVLARVKNAKDIDYVRDQILATIKTFHDQPVRKERLENVKKHLRYSFSQRLDNSESVAAIVARYVALRRTAETIDKLFAVYAQLTPEDVHNAAAKYLVENSRTIVTLTGPAGGAR
jgi:zinc protease